MGRKIKISLKECFFESIPFFVFKNLDFKIECAMMFLSLKIMLFYKKL